MLCGTSACTSGDFSPGEPAHRAPQHERVRPMLQDHGFPQVSKHDQGGRPRWGGSADPTPVTTPCPGVPGWTCCRSADHHGSLLSGPQAVGHCCQGWLAGAAARPASRPACPRAARAAPPATFSARAPEPCGPGGQPPPQAPGSCRHPALRCQQQPQVLLLTPPFLRDNLAITKRVSRGRNMQCLSSPNDILLNRRLGSSEMCASSLSSNPSALSQT